MILPVPSTRPGYIALLSVLIISAVAASTVLILFITSLTTSLNSSDTSRGKIAKGLAEACAEVALQSLRDGTISADCTNCATFAFTKGSCVITLADNTTGDNWDIRTTGTSSVGSITKYLEIKAQKPVNIEPTVTSWKECLDATIPCVLP
jgi:hypothetical protein